MKLRFSEGFFEEYANIKFHNNQSSGSGVVACGQAKGRTDTNDIIIAFRNFGKAPKNIMINHQHRAGVLMFFVPWTPLDSTVKPTERASVKCI